MKDRTRSQARRERVRVLLATIALVYWAAVPFGFRLMGERPPWHDIRVRTVGWLVGTVLFQAVELAVQRYRRRSGPGSPSETEAGGR